MYPVNMSRTHVTAAQSLDASPNLSNLDSDLDFKTTLPSISELENSCKRNDQSHNSNFCSLSKISSSSSNRMTLPVPNCTSRKKAISMPIVNSSSGIEVLLPPAPDLANPFNSFNSSTIQNQLPIELPPLELPDKNYETQTSPISVSSTSPLLSLPSPPSSQFFASPKTTPSGLYNTTFEKPILNPPTPTNSSPPLSPRNTFLNSDNATNSPISRPTVWNNNNNNYKYGSFGTFSTFSQKGDGMEVDRIEIIF
jgi:hypothetical protein